MVDDLQKKYPVEMVYAEIERIVSGVLDKSDADLRAKRIVDDTLDDTLDDPNFRAISSTHIPGGAIMTEGRFTAEEVAFADRVRSVLPVYRLRELTTGTVALILQIGREVRRIKGWENPSARYDPVPETITYEQTGDAIRRIVEYLEDDESKDYDKCKGAEPGHIYEAVREVRLWLDGHLE